MDSLVFFVNGRKVTEPSPDPLLTLLNYLRGTLHLTGSKKACDEGGCGSCTVLISKYDHVNKEIRHRAVVACLVPLCSVHGCAVTTIEGLGTTRTGLHPIQKRLVENHGIQCGYCSPGMIMSMTALLRNKPRPSEQDVEKTIEGNLCRCTGYRPILKAFRSFCKEENVCALGDQCCNADGSAVGEAGHHQFTAPFTPFDPSQSSIFPSELQIDKTYSQSKLTFMRRNVSWLRPTTLGELLDMRQQYPQSVLVAGSTKTIFQLRETGEAHVILISPVGVPDMMVTEHLEKGLKLGANLTISDALETLEVHAERLTEHQAKSVIMVKELWERVGSVQLRNMITIGGSMAASNFNSDVVVALIGAGAKITIISPNKQVRTVTMDEDLLTRNMLKPGDVILNIFIPFSGENDLFHSFKQSWRRTMDSAIVNASFRVSLDGTTNKVVKALLCLGGVGDQPLVAKESSALMLGRQWTDHLVEEVYQSLTKELGSEEKLNHWQYRQSLVLSFFFKFSLFVKKHLQETSLGVSINGELSEKIIANCGREVSQGTQVWEEVSPEQPLEDPVGRPVSHRSAEQLSTGEALFYSDMPAREDEVFLALVRSSKAHAKILDINYSQAMNMEGVVGYVNHKDVPGLNAVGYRNEEEVYAVSEVFYVGQVICGIVAVGEHQARAAAKKVMVTYEELPAIFTIEEAIAAGSFFNTPDLVVERGNIDTGMKEADEVLEGIMRIGCQDHFYMETQCSVVVPTGEVEEYHVYCGTQDIALAQMQFAKTLNIPYNKVVIHQKRIGGGFGGKLIRSAIGIVLQPAAVAAHKFRKSVRCHLTREEDLTTTGGRHPFLAKYKVGLNKRGRILALDMVLYCNAGATIDVSQSIATVSMHHVDGGYNIPHVKSRAYLVRTNLPTPTSMRGYGKPQAVLACEQVVDHVAERLGIEAEQVREMNLCQDGDCDLSGEILTYCYAKKCWSELKDSSHMAEWRRDVEQFNRDNHWKKRGLAAVGTRFGIGGFSTTSFYQAGALVNVYKDGSVLLAHSGVEMGQGLNTKMIQIASRVLEIPQDLIHIDETSSHTVPNTIETGASMGTDWNGPAVMEACKKIIHRLRPVKEANPDGKWETWVNTAFDQRISLSATGFNSFPEEDLSDYDLLSKSGCLFRYFTYGAACSEVEIDCLTGEHTICRTDIVIDVGRSINPAIDIGQVEGAFMQGRGLFTLEEIKYNKDGVMLSRGPDSYKMPLVTDIPVSLNISILKGASYPKGVYSSKAIGEPPLFLATSVFFAIKNAIRAFRRDANLSTNFQLDSPATAERIRMACEDKITKLVCDAKDALPEWRA